MIQNEDYEGLLKICPFKEEISKKAANTYLDQQYLNRAVNRIMKNEELVEKIRNNYFSEIVSYINI